jgi:hypothetical protein
LLAGLANSGVFSFVEKEGGDHMKKKQSAERTFSAMAAVMAANPKTGAPPNKLVYMLKRIGSTTYKVAVHFPPDAEETAADKISRHILPEKRPPPHGCESIAGPM